MAQVILDNEDTPQQVALIMSVAEAEIVRALVGAVSSTLARNAKAPQDDRTLWTSFVFSHDLFSEPMYLVNTGSEISMRDMRKDP